MRKLFGVNYSDPISINEYIQNYKPTSRYCGMSPQFWLFVYTSFSLCRLRLLLPYSLQFIHFHSAQHSSSISMCIWPLSPVFLSVWPCVYIHTCPSHNFSVSAFPFERIPAFIPLHLHLHLSGDIPHFTSVKTFFLRFVVYQTVTHSSVSSAFLFVILPGSRSLSHTWSCLCVFSR